MSVSRRKFLSYGAACALTTGVVLHSPLAVFGQNHGRGNPSEDFRIPFEATTSPSFYFTRATFEPYVGSTFTAAGVGGARVELTLKSVRPYAPAERTRLTTKTHRKTDSFSLHFRASGELRQLTSIHTLEHAALGKFDLFLTGGEVKGEWLYEAVINHAVQS